MTSPWLDVLGEPRRKTFHPMLTCIFGAQRYMHTHRGTSNEGCSEQRRHELSSLTSALLCLALRRNALTVGNVTPVRVPFHRNIVPQHIDQSFPKSQISHNQNARNLAADKNFPKSLAKMATADFAEDDAECSVVHFAAYALRPKLFTLRNISPSR